MKLGEITHKISAAVKRNRIHYVTQIFGVLSIQVPIWAGLIASYPENSNYFNKSFALGTLSLFIERCLFVHVYNYPLKKKRKILYFTITSIIVIAISPTVHLIVFNLVKYILWPSGVSEITWEIIWKLTNSIFVAGSYYTVIYLFTFFWLQFREQKEKALKASVLANEAQLKMLQYQINPHFLFNSLNAIQSMIEKDKELAKSMIVDLSDFFRYTLSGKNQVFITLKDEIDAIQKYLAIQKERFTDRLHVGFEIDEKTLGLKIPAFLVHPLIENAIKYGFSVDNDVLQLIVKAHFEGNNIIIMVKNSGVLKSENEYIDGKIQGTKTGIENIKKRLELLYPGKSGFELFEKDNWVTAKITIEN